MDLRDAMRSPELALEPPAGLEREARRAAVALRRRRAGGSLAAVAAVAALGLVAVVPGLGGEDSLAPPSFATVPGATTPVIALGDLNGAEAVTYWKGASWCYGVSRITTTHGCTNGVRGADAFPAVAGPAESALRVDGGQASQRQLVAGLLGSGVARVEVRLVADGTSAEGRAEESRQAAATRRQAGFPYGVWWLEVPRGSRVVGYEAFDAAGATLATRQS